MRHAVRGQSQAVPGRRARGGTLLTVLVVIALSLMAAFVVAGASYYHLLSSAHLSSATEARNLAEAVVNRAVARLAKDRNWGTHLETLRIDQDAIPDLPEGNYAILTFNPAVKAPRSTQNVAGENSTPGYKGVVVPRHSVHLLGHARAAGVERTVEAIVHFPKFNFTVASSGDLVLDNSVVAALPDPSKVKRDSTGKVTTDPNELQPGDAVSNATMVIKDGSVVTGDAQAHVDIRVENSTVEGELRRPAQVEDLPAIDVTDFDPADKEYALEMDPVVGGAELTGISRSDGALVVNGDLALDNAVLYVNGNLKVTGGVRGVGAVFVNGAVDVGGAVNLAATDNVALLAEGSVHLHGTDKTRHVFQGLLYARGDIVVETLTLLGTAICHGRIGGEKMVFRDVNNVHVPNYSAPSTFWPTTFVGDVVGPYTRVPPPGQVAGRVSRLAPGKNILLAGEPPPAGLLSAEAQAELADAQYVPLYTVFNWMVLKGEPISGKLAYPGNAWAHPAPNGARAPNTWGDVCMFTIQMEDGQLRYITTHHGNAMEDAGSWCFVIPWGSLDHMATAMASHAAWLNDQDGDDGTWANVIKNMTRQALRDVGIDPDNPKPRPNFTLDPSQFLKPEDRMRVLLWREWKDPTP